MRHHGKLEKQNIREDATDFYPDFQQDLEGTRSSAVEYAIDGEAATRQTQLEAQLEDAYSGCLLDLPSAKCGKQRRASERLFIFDWP